MISDDNAEHEFLVGSMGSEIKEGDLSIHYIKLNKNKSKVIKHKIITIGERIRDMIYYNSKLYLYLEDTASLAEISFN